MFSYAARLVHACKMIILYGPTSIIFSIKTAFIIVKKFGCTVAVANLLCSRRELCVTLYSKTLATSSIWLLPVCKLVSCSDPLTHVEKRVWCLGTILVTRRREGRHT